MNWDVVGVGALNVDAVVAAPPGQRVEDGERRADDAEVAALLAASPARRLRLGGSAFTAVAALARANPDLRVAFAGVAGRVPPGAEPFEDALRRLGVDARLVASDRGPAGLCVAVEGAGARRLRVAPGANLRAGAHFTRERARLLRELCAARVVHVTSFLDEVTPGVLADILAEARAAAPGLLVSVDPGAVWCASGDPGVRRITALADVLTVNTAEAAALVGERAGAAVLVKSPDGVEVRTGGRTVAQVCHERVPDDGVRNPTGAGDAFAAGLLGVLAREPEDVVPAVRAGLSAARAHLTAVG